MCSAFRGLDPTIRLGDVNGLFGLNIGNFWRFLMWLWQRCNTNTRNKLASIVNQNARLRFEDKTPLAVQLFRRDRVGQSQSATQEMRGLDGQVIDQRFAPLLQQSKTRATEIHVAFAYDQRCCHAAKTGLLQ